MKLVVCGCSWSSRDNTHPDTEYGYFVSNHFGWEYQNIARVSGSNFNIRLQIDYAVKHLNPDFIIVNWTTPDRVDWNHKGNLYDTDLEAHKQYYMMESAVNQMQRANIKFLFCPNTFNWKQNIQERFKLTDEEKHKYYIEGFTYDFVPEESLQLYHGIADALAWDYEYMEDPISNPNHNHSHHLSAKAQKRWATEIAIPKIKDIL